MQSLESYQKEFLKEKEKFEGMGYELIGTNSNANEILFFTVKKKDK